MPDLYIRGMEKTLNQAMNEFNNSNNPQDKIALMHFIDKLTLQKELLELQAGITNLADIQIAAQRLGMKSQSAFEGK